MASATQVRTYLAHWFQLGKKLLWRNGEKELLPRPVTQGDQPFGIAPQRFSSEFENCWQKIMSIGGKDCYLEGSNETIEELLSSVWNISSCNQCNMPVPLIELGTQPLACACNDLENWPNFELPAPRSPVNNSAQLNRIKSRLETK